MNEYVDYLCDLIASEPDNERQLVLVKLLEFQLSQTTLQTQNRVTQFLRKIPKDTPAA
ncbi:MAG TPA: hypothetical protein VLK33_09725 [Terriglobales bacterium]|nr:hypothetical protein [Terriglobales bacterium]